MERISELTGNIEEEAKVFDAKYEDVKTSISKAEAEFAKQKSEILDKRSRLKEWITEVIAKEMGSNAQAGASTAQPMPESGSGTSS